MVLDKKYGYAREKKIIDGVRNCCAALGSSLFPAPAYVKGCSQLSKRGRHSVFMDLNSFSVQSSPAEHP